jgi:CBS-domain-containing membrane protein
MSTAGKRLGAANFSQKKVDEMLNAIETWLPIGAEDWESVARTYNTAASMNRTAESLKKSSTR